MDEPRFEVLRQTFGVVDIVCYVPSGIEIEINMGGEGVVVGDVIEIATAPEASRFGLKWRPGCEPGCAVTRDVRGGTPEAVAEAFNASGVEEVQRIIRVMRRQARA